MAHEAGKGDTFRPVNQTLYAENWDRVFGHKARAEKALDEMVRLSEELGLYDEPMQHYHPVTDTKS